jgi:hypothetical protein
VARQMPITPTIMRITMTTTITRFTWKMSMNRQW